MIAYIFLQNFISEGTIEFIFFLAVLAVLLIAFIGSSLITLIYKLIQKNVNRKRLMLLFFISFISLIILMSTILYFIIEDFIYSDSYYAS